ncbi:MAG TPA: DUF6412 domain-containing protein [Microbacteriaceae bacterium]|nr:DUF6412 domain-containing protein [Microbacteriaceae bacterium]
MFQTLQFLAHYIVAGTELLWAANGGFGNVALTGVVGIGVVGLGVMIALLCVSYLTAIARSMPGGVRRERLSEPADIAVLLSQSDPDADGHARPRAPAFSLAVA